MGLNCISFTITSRKCMRLVPKPLVCQPLYSNVFRFAFVWMGMLWELFIHNASYLCFLMLLFVLQCMSMSWRRKVASRKKIKRNDISLTQIISFSNYIILNNYRILKFFATSIIWFWQYLVLSFGTLAKLSLFH